MKNWNKPEVDEMAIKMTAKDGGNQHDKTCPLHPSNYKGNVMPDRSLCTCHVFKGPSVRA